VQFQPSAVFHRSRIDTRACLYSAACQAQPSLLAGRYYEYKHNAFWKIMGELFGAGPDVAYEKRVVLLKRSGLAVWDVLESCVREGSLDSAIDEISIVPNDFRKFFASHPRIGHVFFNGGMAETSFRRYVRPHLSETGIRFARLPSTSPAHAARNFETKLKAWRAVAESPERIMPARAGIIPGERVRSLRPFTDH